MATLQKEGLLVGKDQDGNTVLIYPITTMDNVDGLNEALDAYLPLAGGKLTGNLTGQYLTGTWLQGTASNHHESKQDKVVVQDSSGWLYHRTLAELLADLGAASKAIHTKTTLAAATWNKTAKTYSFESTYPFASYDISIQPDKTCTAEQLDAYIAMMPLGSSDSNVITAGGDVPTVDIPIIIEVVAK